MKEIAKINIIEQIIEIDNKAYETQKANELRLQATEKNYLERIENYKADILKKLQYNEVAHDIHTVDKDVPLNSENENIHNQLEENYEKSEKELVEKIFAKILKSEN